MRTLAIVAMLLVSPAGLAQCFGGDIYKTCTDQYGNTYSIQKYGSTTDMQGYNSRTGSSVEPKFNDLRKHYLPKRHIIRWRAVEPKRFDPHRLGLPIPVLIPVVVPSTDTAIPLGNCN